VIRLAIQEMRDPGGGGSHIAVAAGSSLSGPDCVSVGK
jgi:hypothetical protein